MNAIRYGTELNPQGSRKHVQLLKRWMTVTGMFVIYPGWIISCSSSTMKHANEKREKVFQYEIRQI